MRRLSRPDRRQPGRLLMDHEAMIGAAMRPGGPQGVLMSPATGVAGAAGAGGVSFLPDGFCREHAEFFGAGLWCQACGEVRDNG